MSCVSQTFRPADRPTDDSGRHRDLVCLNTGDGQLLDVSSQAKVVETRFSQGLAVGDVNGAGFPDVMVANLSANRLWLNNGDGTFRDMAWPGSSGRWTGSVPRSPVLSSRWWLAGRSSVWVLAFSTGVTIWWVARVPVPA